MVYPLKTGVLVVGAKGFLGRHLYDFFKKQGWPTVGTHHVASKDLFSINLLDPEITFPLDAISVACIAAGIGNPRKCEENPEMSYQCNVQGTLALGKELLKRGILPIFFSSDYVFDGGEKSYSSSSAPAPLNTYGKQKAELESRATEIGALVIRLSKVYGIERGDQTLFDEIAEKLEKNADVKAAEDQIFAPIWAGDVARGVCTLAEQKKTGVYNFAGPQAASRLEMAHFVAKSLGFDLSRVQRISIADLNDGVLRPKRVVLEPDVPAISWKEGVKRYAENRKRNLGPDV